MRPRTVVALLAAVLTAPAVSWAGTAEWKDFTGKFRYTTRTPTFASPDAFDALRESLEKRMPAFSRAVRKVEPVPEPAAPAKREAPVEKVLPAKELKKIKKAYPELRKILRQAPAGWPKSDKKGGKAPAKGWPDPADPGNRKRVEEWLDPADPGNQERLEDLKRRLPRQPPADDISPDLPVVPDGWPKP